MLDNPILQMLSGSQQNPQNNIMRQAVGAMLRGETPQSFLQNLAKTSPELQALDLSDPNKAAEKLYSDKGQDINAAKSSIMDKVSAFMKH
jgi:hypothetical protein